MSLTSQFDSEFTANNAKIVLANLHKEWFDDEVFFALAKPTLDNTKDDTFYALPNGEAQLLWTKDDPFMLRFYPEDNVRELIKTFNKEKRYLITIHHHNVQFHALNDAEENQFRKLRDFNSRAWLAAYDTVQRIDQAIIRNKSWQEIFNQFGSEK